MEFRVVLAFIPVLLCAYCYGADFGDNDEITGTDDFIKKLLEGWGPRHDPYKIIDYRDIQFNEDRILDFELLDGRLIGFKTLHSSDHCLEEQNGTLVIKATLVSRPFYMEFNGSVKSRTYAQPETDYHLTAIINAELSYHETEMEFTVDANTGMNGMILKFRNVKTEGLNIHLSQMIQERDKVIRFVDESIQKTLFWAIEKNLRNTVEWRLSSYRFPVDDRQPKC